MIEIIPKKEPQNFFLSNLFTLSLILFFGVVIALFISLILQGKTRAKIQEIEAQLSQRRSGSIVQQEDRVRNYEKKIRDLKILLQKRPDSVSFLRFLEANTHPKVVFTELQFSPVTKSLVLKGKTPDFRIIEEQLLLFKEKKDIVQTKLADIGIGKEGDIVFSIELSFLSTPTK